MAKPGKQYAILIQIRDILFLTKRWFINKDSKEYYTRWVERDTAPSNIIEGIDAVFDLSTGETDPRIFKIVAMIEANDEKYERIDTWFCYDRKLGKTSIEDLVAILEKL